MVLIMIGAFGLWGWAFYYGNARVAEASEWLVLETGLPSAQVRATVDKVGKPLNRLALNKPSWVRSGCWERRFDRGTGRKHSDALLRVEVFEPGDPESPRPDHAAGAVVSVGVAEWSGYRRLGVKVSDALFHALKVRKKILATLSQSA